MKHQQIYNLEEFANKYQLTDIFGAYAAYLSVGFTLPTGVDVLHHFKEMVQQRTLFTKLLLIRKGTATVVISEQDERKTLNADSLLVMTSRHVINEIELSPDFKAECVLVDTDMVDENTIYHLTEEKHKSVSDVFNIIHNIVRHQTHQQGRDDSVDVQRASPHPRGAALRGTIHLPRLQAQEGGVRNLPPSPVPQLP